MNPEKVLTTSAGPHWNQIGSQHHHGICVPLFSLHSENSCGIGEFSDLIPLIDWVKDVGMDIIQLLPLNDTGLGTSPYSAISAFALSPIYLNLTELPGSETLPDFHENIGKLRYWSRTHRVKYHIVRELKFSILRDYFSRHFSEISISKDYQNFINENRSWLEPYALFKSLKEMNFWKHWEEWPTNMKSPSIYAYSELIREYQRSIDFHTFLQYLSFQQLEKVKNYATSRGVFLKGDIPILISRDSADVWHNRQYFFHHLAAGAPPDMFARDGQYWGFPVYDWEEMAKNNYSWWRERLKVASQLYHLYRLDHVVGFFRLWAIEEGKPANLGSFLPPLESEWIPHGKKLMEMMLQATTMLPVGEDLGMVPSSVKEELYSLGIPGTKVIRWERRWDEDGGFIPVHEYPLMTLTTVSTHDSDTLQLWWRHSPKEAKLYAAFKGWPYEPFLSHEQQEAILRDAHHSNSLLHINLLQEYLALFPELVCKNPHNERINIPGKVLDTNWTYRFKPSVEKITSHIPLKEKISSILRLKKE